MCSRTRYDGKSWDFGEEVSAMDDLALPIHDDVQFGAWAALGDFGRTGTFGYFTV
jgi:hypothetical protein